MLKRILVLFCKVLLIPFVLVLFIFRLLILKFLTPGRKYANIIEGFTNYIIENPAVETVSKQRALICSKCPSSGWSKIKGPFCKKCGCNLSFKTRSLDETCPLNKW